MTVFDEQHLIDVFPWGTVDVEGVEGSAVVVRFAAPVADATEAP